MNIVAIDPSPSYQHPQSAFVLALSREGRPVGRIAVRDRNLYTIRR